VALVMEGAGSSQVPCVGDQLGDFFSNWKRNMGMF
jgi:hypothetical protein